MRHWPAVWRYREKVIASRRLFEFNYTNWLYFSVSQKIQHPSADLWMSIVRSNPTGMAVK